MGPATANDEVVEQLLVAGMNIARFNFSHGTHQSHQEAMERVRRAAKKVGKPVALLLDTKGPEIRTGDTVDGGTVTIKAGDKVIVTSDGQKTQAPGKMEGGGQGTEKPALLSVSWKELPKEQSQG